MPDRPTYPQATTAAELQANFQAVQAKINAACARAGRSPDQVRLLPVSKTVSAERLRLAVGLGYTRFGENKIQEAQAKWQAMSGLPVKWSVIGHLQSNKIKYLVKFADEFQALDNTKTAELLNEKLRQANRSLDVLIQINTSGEESKYGLHPEQAAAFIRDIARFDRLNIRGLMTLALLSDNTAQVRGCFTLLRQLRDQLRPNLPDHMRMDELSMGMSGDFETAIEEGATIVRIGQALFGARNLPDSHYWPEQTTAEDPQQP
ncbi:MAG: YggS family pyridoxal phosphate-dependent enzyme [Neisseria sp.]|nr:YggS family pyridoxal phosphate-dependent enzyme [Neisseria sp.]